MKRKPWKKRHRELKIRHLKLQARYYRLKAKMIAGEPIIQGERLVTKKKYYDILGKLKRCQAINAELRQKLADASNQPF